MRAGIAPIAALQEKTQGDSEGLNKLQGEWEVVTVHFDHESADPKKFATRCEVKRATVIPRDVSPQFKLLIEKGLDIAVSDKDGPTIYSRLKSLLRSRGVAVDYDDRLPNQIAAPWYVGLYRFNGDGTLELVLKYYGQGIEGEAARHWKPPVDFERRAVQGHVHVILRRPGRPD